MMDKDKTVDLDRVRRARADLKRAAAACNTERTSRYLAGELPGVPADAIGDETMGTKMFRVPEDLWDRAERLVASMETAPELAAAGRKGTSAVLRVALSEGLAGLDERYLLVEEAQELGTMGEVRVVVNASDPGAAYLQGGRALAYWVGDEPEIRISRTAIPPERREALAARVEMMLVTRKHRKPPGGVRRWLNARLRQV